MAREKVRDWRRDGIAQNGVTDELEVLIQDSDRRLYEGSFANIPDDFWHMSVLEVWRTVDSSISDRIGMITLVV